jgi:hypothetical protein
MHTLFDFTSSVSAVQYLLSLLFILGFIIFNEILKPMPFEGLLKAVSEDIRFIRSQKKVEVTRLIKNITLAPVYALFYFASLPALFIQGVTVIIGKGLVDVSSAGWSPLRAYFTGRRKAKKSKKDNAGQGDSD